MATTQEFTEENKALLESLPAPDVAKAYYEGDDFVLFDEFQTTTLSSTGEVMSLKLDKDGTTDNATGPETRILQAVQRSKPYTTSLSTYAKTKKNTLGR